MITSFGTDKNRTKAYSIGMSSENNTDKSPKSEKIWD